MFGHLKAEEFTNLIENIGLSAQRIAHLESCTRCRTTFESMRNIQARMVEPEHEDAIPEPDWTDFRSGVRDAMLSRSVQRDSTIRRWTGLALRPATAWALSIMFVVGVGTGVWVWNKPAIEPTQPAISQIEIGADTVLSEREASSWSQGDVFDQLAQLKADELENLRLLLEADAAKDSVK
jgi:hypothetical protein